MKTRRPLAILAASAVAGLGLTALASPASADTTVTVDQNAQVSPSSITGTSVTLNNDSGQDLVVVSLFLSDGDEACSLDKDPFCNVQQNGPTETFNIAPGASGASVSLRIILNGGLQEVATFTVTYSDGSAPAPAPAVVDITLDQITSEVLRTWASTATVGSWKELPESSEIIGVDENAGKTFLGAATTPNFPVDIAQRQVDNGWGAYETFNDDGELTSVFIPAGGWMAISNSTRLYAIWSD